MSVLTKSELRTVRNVLEFVIDKQKKSEDYLTYDNVCELMRLDKIRDKVENSISDAPLDSAVY